jgi:cytochrome c oxidase assembly protein subunit 15
MFAAARLRRLRPHPTTARLTHAIAVLVGVQLAAGTINVILLAPVWMQILHLLLADALWLTLVLAAASALAEAPAGEATGAKARPSGVPAAV